MQIIGHKTQWELLRKMVDGGRLPQAFLFVGDSSLGKKKVAFEFLKLLNCEEKDFQKRPCGVCISCSLIERVKHPDLIFIAPQKREIQISQVREVQKALNFRPQFSNFKSVIIDNAHVLNSEAQNCLLKTIEEPKGKTIFFLITSHPEFLFETLRSRCEILKFYPVSFEMVKKYFGSRISSGHLRKIFLLSEGRPGIAINFLDNHQTLSRVLENFKDAQYVLNSNLYQKFLFVKEFSKRENSSEEISFFLENFIRYLRMLFLKELGVEESSFVFPCNKNSQCHYPIQNINKAIDLIESFKFIISTTNVNRELSLENLMIDIQKNF